MEEGEVQIDVSLFTSQLETAVLCTIEAPRWQLDHKSGILFDGHPAEGTGGGLPPLGVSC